MELKYDALCVSCSRVPESRAVEIVPEEADDEFEYSDVTLVYRGGEWDGEMEIVELPSANIRMTPSTSGVTIDNVRSAPHPAVSSSRRAFSHRVRAACHSAGSAWMKPVTRGYHSLTFCSYSAAATVSCLC
jgi:hypothetical protein